MKKTFEVKRKTSFIITLLQVVMLIGLVYILITSNSNILSKSITALVIGIPLTILIIRNLKILILGEKVTFDNGLNMVLINGKPYSDYQDIKHLILTHSKDPDSDLDHYYLEVIFRRKPSIELKNDYNIDLYGLAHEVSKFLNKELVIDVRVLR